MNLKTVLLVQVVTLVSWLPCTFSYCTWAGANPYWTGTPTVEQITLTSVRVSWAGLLERSDCADSLIVKHFKGDNTNDFMMSDPLDTETNSYIVRDVVPNQMYTYQVIAREEKGLLGVDYNRSPKTVFTTLKSNKIIDKNSPLPPVVSPEGGSSGQGEDHKGDQRPVYSPEVKTGSSILNPPTDAAILGMKLEVFMGVVIGGLIVFIVAVGIVYNVFRKKDLEKDIELEFESGSDDDSSDEEEEEEAFESNKQEVKKYDMMIAVSEKNAPELQHSLSSP